MMKKTMIISLILCSFLIASVSTVIAADTFTDKTGDVINYDTGENVTSSPNIDIENIDIVEMTYSRQGITITLTLKVKGDIENRGSINEFESEDNIDVVVYSLSLSTSNESYDIIYVNNECQITYGSTGEIENISKSDFSAEDSTLTVTFDLLSNDETYEDIYGETSYFKMSGDTYEYLDDTAPNVVDLEVIIDAPSEGIIGENIDFSGEANGASPYNWSWDFDDGETSYGPNPTHSYTKAGTYEIILYVTDAGGNQGSNSKTLTISDSGTSNGGDHNGNQESESSNSGLILFVVIIAVIVIAGVAVVVYIVRR